MAQIQPVAAAQHSLFGYTGDRRSHDGYLGTFNARVPVLVVDADNGWVLSGFFHDVGPLFMDMDGSPFGTDVDFWRAALLKSVLVRFALPANSDRNVALAGCSFMYGWSIKDVDVTKASSGEEDEHVVHVTMTTVPLPNKWHDPAQPAPIFVEVNMHRPDFQFFKPDSVMMFGETFQAAAWLVLVPGGCVNVVFGSRCCDFAEQQFSFLRNLTDQSRVTKSDAILTGEVPIKLRLDWLSGTIAAVYSTDPRGVAERVRVACLQPAKNHIVAAGLHETLDHYIRELTGTQAGFACSLDGSDLARWATIWNRQTSSNNNPEMDLTHPQLNFILTVLRSSHVSTVLLAGSRFTGVMECVLEKHADSFRYVDITNFEQHESFKECFPDDDTGLRISGQLYVQQMLADAVCLTVGPHSGATDHLGLNGFPVVFYTASDHPAHPRMPRLCNHCSWWECVATGSMKSLKQARQLALEDPLATNTGMGPQGEERLSHAIMAAIACQSGATEFANNRQPLESIAFSGV